MTDFSQLPNEMISEIWGHIHEPRDVESFALVSQLIYAIGRPFVAEHNALVREYSEFDTDDSRAAALLKDVLLRPRVALYVVHVITDCCERPWWVKKNDRGDDDDVDDSHYLDEFMPMSIEAIQKRNILAPKDVQCLIQQIRIGNEDPILALLLLLLPNISTMTLPDQGWIHREYCFRTIQRIAEAKQTKSLIRLRTVNIWLPQLPDSEFISSLDCVKELARLPLLQSMNIRLQNVSFLPSIIMKDPLFQPDTSKITTWTFSYDGLRPSLVFQLTKSIKGLVTFSCVDKGDKGIGFQKFWDSTPPLTKAKHSLESLKFLSLRKGRNGFLGSFHEYTALKEMEIELSLLIGRGDRPGDLLGMLPPSVEKLHLHTREVRPLILPEIVKSIMQAKSQLFPRLSVLQIEIEHKIRAKSMVGKAMGSLREEGHKVGIELELIGQHHSWAVWSATFPIQQSM